MTLGYTLLCVLALAATAGLERLLRTGLLRDRRYWITLAIVGVFQLLVDGWLTCRPIVLYDEAQFSSLRLGCPRTALFAGDGAGLGMPVEDLVFGFTMVTQTLMWWVWWGRRSAREVSASPAPAAGRDGGGTGPAPRT